MQSGEWLDAFRDERETVESVVSERAGEIVACSRIRRVSSILTGEKCFVDGGPVFDSDAVFESHLRELLKSTGDSALLRLRPHLTADEGTVLRAMLADHGFQFPPASAQSGYALTLVLDLTQPMQSLQAGFSQHLRRSLRRAVRAGLVIERTTDTAAIADFARLLARGASKAAYDVPPPERIERFLGAVCRTEPAAGALFCARERGALRAGIVVLRAGDSLVFQWGARDDSGEDTAPLTHALHVEALAWGQSLEYRHYDFGGLFSADATNGIDRFKRSFGGRVQAQFGEAVRRRGLRGWVSAQMVRPRRASAGVGDAQAT